MPWEENLHTFVEIDGTYNIQGDRGHKRNQTHPKRKRQTEVKIKIDQPP